MKTFLRRILKSLVWPASNSFDDQRVRLCPLSIQKCGLCNFGKRIFQKNIFIKKRRNQSRCLGNLIFFELAFLKTNLIQVQSEIVSKSRLLTYWTWSWNKVTWCSTGFANIHYWTTVVTYIQFQTGWSNRNHFTFVTHKWWDFWHLNTSLTSDFALPVTDSLAVMQKLKFSQPTQ